MIKQIRGTILEKTLTGVVLDVSGWGVLVHTPQSTPILAEEGSILSLKTYLAITQSGVDLYGFMTDADRTFFELLLTVSGVGPKTALSIFSRGSRESLENAIGARDIGYLTRIVGLGKKAAEKLAVELSEKVTLGDGARESTDDAEVLDTLIALGYTEREARKAVGNVPLHITGRDARLKAALSGAT